MSNGRQRPPTPPVPHKPQPRAVAPLTSKGGFPADTSRLLDWGQVERQVHAVLTTGQNTSRAAAHVTFERAREGRSLADAVQEAIAEVLELPEVPATTEEAIDIVVEHARRRLKAWRKTTNERSRNLELMGRSAFEPELFDIICDRNEHIFLIQKLFGALSNDLNARMILYAVLKNGIPYHKTLELSYELDLPPPEIDTAKRRLIRQANKIMKDMIGPGSNGVLS